MLVCEQLKQMEVQLEEEYEEKQKVLRERRDLEAKLMSAKDQVKHSTYYYILYYIKIWNTVSNMVTKHCLKYEQYCISPKLFCHFVIL